MSRFSRVVCFLSPLALGLAIATGCGDDSSTTSSTTGSTSSGTTSTGMGGSGSTSSSTGLSSTSSGFTTSSSSSSSDASSSSSSGGGTSGTDFVGAGDVLKSPNFKMIMTLGQPSQNQGVQTSGKYKMHGGLVGATN